ncbi:WXG100 family type VII secretion target [Streptomyces hesseae]|uniref:ESAT-6-like protein n=1 Tax=Streptomyces hesseae TaxID=3075519 RepID=A0ABU2SVH5_9ACTN|nr:WXG100 family type VII secretion target [Streptomyces sp. DSM 40473]MDT0452626.1 WXG100 family type VII secretion target [Streptomyces sp. DSM 40473]
MATNGGELLVTYASLRETAGQIKGAAGVIQNEIAAMKSAVANVSAGWEGEAKTAMEDAQKRLQDKANKIGEILERVSAKIQEGADHYQVTDVKASRLFTEGY